MHALIHQELTLPKLPSASGVELVGRTAYIIGDDTPFLYCFDADSLQAGQPLQLFETAHFSFGRIPKDRKPDLECLTALTTAEGQPGLLVLGSGATAAREVGFWVPLAAAGQRAASVYPLNLTVLYALLRPHLPAGVGLNLEAVAASADTLLLFQRSVGQATNQLFSLPLHPTLDFIWQRTPQPPTMRVQAYAPPRLEGHAAGLSGASVFAEQLFVSASVEATTDPILDGAVLGSYVGCLDPTARPADALRLAPLRYANGQPYRGKVEGIAVRRQLTPGRFELLLVTDDDAGGSTALLAELEL